MEQHTHPYRYNAAPAGIGVWFSISKLLSALILLLFLVSFFSQKVNAQVNVSGATPPAINISYATLGAAFAAIGTVQAGNNIVITILKESTKK